MTTLAKIKAAGFTVTLKANGNLGIIPADKLTDSQLTYLKNHKPEIIAELKAAQPAQAETTLTNTERQSIANWVRSLGGSEAEIQEETAAVIDQCADPEAKVFFLNYAKGIKPPNPLTSAADTRVHCHHCQHHRPIKDRIQIIHCTQQNRRYLDDMPRNCDDFEAKLDTGD